MKKILLIIIPVLIILGITFAQTRVYKQIKSVSLHQTGKVIESVDKGNLFEVTLEIDEATDRVTKTNIKRLDQDSSWNINKNYTIKKDKTTLGSQMGEGGKTIVAVANNGDEILEISEEFLFSSKGSSFSQMITGIYKRIK
ncbi:MAG: hypothetical protein PHF25_08195 [Candidatus Margulisbacteria bacterium]|nr:hypothetical protein [Candidatus Margulisiibacteriota bacterium]